MAKFTHGRVFSMAVSRIAMLSLHFNLTLYFFVITP